MADSLYFGPSVGSGSNPFDQNLNTDDSPTFAGVTLTGNTVGVQSAFGPNAAINFIDPDYYGSDTAYIGIGFADIRTVAPGKTYYVGNYSTVDLNLALDDATTKYYGIATDVFTNSGSTKDYLSINAVYMSAFAQGDGDINFLTSLEIYPGTNYGSGTVSTAYGIRMGPPSNSGGGVITNNRAINIENQTLAGATSYALFYNGPSNGKFSLAADGSVVAENSVTSPSHIVSDGGALKGDTTTAHTYKFQVYDVNGTVYRDWMTATNGDAPSVAITAPSTGTLTISGMNLSTAIAPAGSGLKRFLCIDENGVVTSQATACAI